MKQLNEVCRMLDDHVKPDVLRHFALVEHTAYQRFWVKSRKTNIQVERRYTIPEVVSHLTFVSGSTPDRWVNPNFKGPGSAGPVCRSALSVHSGVV